MCSIDWSFCANSVYEFLKKREKINVKDEEEEDRLYYLELMKRGRGGKLSRKNGR